MRQEVAKPSASRRFWRTVWSGLRSLACMARASVGPKLAGVTEGDSLTGFGRVGWGMRQTGVVKSL